MPLIAILTPGTFGDDEFSLTNVTRFAEKMEFKRFYIIVTIEFVRNISVKYK